MGEGWGRSGWVQISAPGSSLCMGARGDDAGPFLINSGLGGRGWGVGMGHFWPQVSPQVLGRLLGTLLSDALRLLLPISTHRCAIPIQIPLPQGFQVFCHPAHHHLLLWWDVVPWGGLLYIGGASQCRVLRLLAAHLVQSGHHQAGDNAQLQQQVAQNHLGLPLQCLLHQLSHMGWMTVGAVGGLARVLSSGIHRGLSRGLSKGPFRGISRGPFIGLSTVLSSEVSSGLFSEVFKGLADSQVGRTTATPPCFLLGSSKGDVTTLHLQKGSASPGITATTWSSEQLPSIPVLQEVRNLIEEGGAGEAVSDIGKGGFAIHQHDCQHLLLVATSPCPVIQEVGELVEVGGQVEDIGDSVLAIPQPHCHLLLGAASLCYIL